MRIRAGILLASALVQLSAVSAQRAATLSGTWSVEAAAADVVSPDGSEKWSFVAISGTLQLEHKDKSVTGSWQGRMPAPWALSGSSDGKTFELQTEVRDVPMSRNGEQQTVARRWIFKGTIDGGTLTGSMGLSEGDAAATPSQPFTATRAK